ncbi:MAG: amidase [Chloroflexota bacterium]|nr:MAG: amidase [Chloroflexota bacterium]
MASVNVEEMSIAALQELMMSGQLSARALTETYLYRTEAIDSNGPGLNAILELNPDALTIADELDAERKDQGPRGPLHGIPIVIKGNIDTADRMTTTAGSLALAGSVAAQDAFLVRKLREAGAVILGKANLSEWANFRSSRSSGGWSSQGDQTRNPYALDRNPCGSSSGSAVAAAASLCAATIGTETVGSIICPSQINGIVGIKPTVGLVSRSGIIPISHSLDTAGPMARTVADAAVLLGAMTGVDPRDPVTQDSEGKAFVDYSPFLDAKGLKGARIGVARQYFGSDPRVDQIMEGCITVMKELGAEVIDPADVEGVKYPDEIPPDVIDLTEIEGDKTFFDMLLEVLEYEFNADLNAYLAALGPEAPVRSMTEIIAFNERNRDEVMPYFGQERMLAARESGPLTDEAYLSSLNKIQLLARDAGIDATLAKDNLQAIVAPSGGPAWLTDLINGDHLGGGCSGAAAVAGYPHITVPAGAIFGLPVGISFFSGAYQEPTLIRLAYAFEQATLARRPPQYLPTAEL